MKYVIRYQENNNFTLEGFEFMMYEKQEAIQHEAKYDINKSKIFQEEFFEPLKQVNTSFLGKGKKYLLPIAFKSTSRSKNETPCNRTLEYHKSTIGTDSYHVDYVFQTLEYIRLVPPSGLQKEVKYEIPPPKE